MIVLKIVSQWMLLNLLVTGLLIKNAQASWVEDRRALTNSEISDLLVQPPTKRNFFDGFKNGPPVCKMDQKLLPEMSLENLKAQIAKAESKQKWCDEAFLWSEVGRQYPIRPYYRDSAVETIAYLVRGNDYVEAINQANDFLDQNPGDIQTEEIRFLIVMSVVKAMRAEFVDVDPYWEKFALGLQEGQGLKETFFNTLILSNFLKDFPQSKYLNYVNDWLKEARDRYTANNLLIAKNYIHDGQYYAAIIRLQINMRYGIVTAPFAESMYQMINANILFANLILDSKKLPDKQLRDWLNMDASQNLDRAALSSATKAQAGSFLKTMDQQLPNDSWTAQAHLLFQNPSK